MRAFLAAMVAIGVISVGANWALEREALGPLAPGEMNPAVRLGD
jgi:hypothetical protein